MVRLELCVLTLFVASGLAEQPTQKLADPVLLQKQIDILNLFANVHEPLFIEEQKTVAKTWDIEKNFDKFSDVEAVKIYWNMIKEQSLLPRGAPFAVLEPTNEYEVSTMFKVLFLAKDYETFYNTAVYLRDIVNEELYVYVLSVAITLRPDTQGIVIPPLYEILPSYFFNGGVISEAMKLKIQGDQYSKNNQAVFKVKDFIIKWNNTIWPFWFKDSSLVYYTHDVSLNALYYNVHVTYPTWLGGELFPLKKDRRGEWFWFMHKQIVTRYYLERLSNGLGEIPSLGFNEVEQGYVPGISYSNGMPFPERSEHFTLQQTELADAFRMAWSYENRIYDAIDKGFYINKHGERVSLVNPEDIDALGNLIEANVDSPDNRYFKDVISLWKKILGSSLIKPVFYADKNIPLTLPSALEHYQTAFRDPAFYMIWKHFLKMFTYWQQQLPLYKRDELALPSVAIQKVEVEKLMTYFEPTYINISNALPISEYEAKTATPNFGVIVQRPQLNHKVFKVRVNVKSEVAKRVVVRLFLAPKYDGKGMEIPLHLNTENFFQLDQFIYELPEGETVISRDSSDFYHSIKSWDSMHDLYTKAQEALQGNGQFLIDQKKSYEGVPDRLILPKGRVGGMPFLFMVYISEYHAPKTPYGTGFDPAMSLGIGTGARHHLDEPLGFPVNRPLYKWQIQDVKNIWFQDVLIFHKQSPDEFSL